MMCFRTLAAAGVVAAITISAAAQTPSADERAIRDLMRATTRANPSRAPTM
jgi:hypothetical protein